MIKNVETADKERIEEKKENPRIITKEEFFKSLEERKQEQIRKERIQKIKEELQLKRELKQNINSLKNKNGKFDDLSKDTLNEILNQRSKGKKKFNQNKQKSKMIEELLINNYISIEELRDIKNEKLKPEDIIQRGIIDERNNLLKEKRLTPNKIKDVMNTMGKELKIEYPNEPVIDTYKRALENIENEKVFIKLIKLRLKNLNKEDFDLEATQIIEGIE